MASMLLVPSFVFAEQNVTNLIQNPSFEQSTDGWTVTNLSTQSNNSFTKKSGNIYMEKWTSKGNAVGSGSVAQVLTGLPAGKYRLTAAAQNIQQDQTAAQTGASIYAGTTSNATTVTKADDYSVDFETDASDVTIGFRAVNASGNWICVDNFRLSYLAPDLALLQKAVEYANAAIAAAEKSTMAGIQPAYKTALLEVIALIGTLTAESTEDELTKASFDLAEKQAAMNENAAALKELKTLVNKVRLRLSSDMAEIYKQALQEAYDNALHVLELQDDTDVTTAIQQLDTAYANAEASFQAKKELKTAINSASRAYDESKEGAQEFADKLAWAEAVRDNVNATPEEMIAATTAITDATLFFRIQNATGNPMNVKTLGVVQGVTEIFARGSFTGTGTPKEKGFCYSEEPEPTIFDNRTTFSYSNNGDIYAIQGLKPATVYYVRAYAISSGYQLSYGDVVKVPTRPMGNVTFIYGYEGDQATNDRIYAACEEAVWMWNNIGGIQHFRLDAHYKYGAGAGSGTAECSYGGYMSVSQNTGCQRTGTILHEGAHGLGMVPYTDWTNSIYRTNGDRGDWLGPRVDRVIQFLDNNATAKLHGDNQHMWPYGINGSGEDTGSPILYRANALLVEALSEDGITHRDQGFLTPGYSFSQDDETKYYIKNEAENRGLATSYLCQTSVTAVRFKEMTADEVFSNDSCAWYITFNPSTCYYTFKNVATGRYLSMSTSSVTAVTNQSNGWFQLMGSRNQTSLDGFTFAGTSYWVINSNSHKAMNANAAGAAAVDFNHSDDAVTQRWLFLTSDEVQRFAEARGETVGIRLPKATSQAVATALDVVAGQGVIAITANANGQDVNVFTIDGRRIEHVYVQSGSTAKVRVPRGIYLVGDRKVIVK